MLVEIKQRCLADNNLSLKISGCGKLAVANYIDELIGTVVKLETLYHDYKTSYYLASETRNDYYKLLHYFPDNISDERRAELKTLVNKWLAQDAEEEHEDEAHDH